MNSRSESSHVARGLTAVAAATISLGLLGGCALLTHSHPAGRTAAASSPVDVTPTFPPSPPPWNTPHDSGPRDGATGTVVLNAAGVPVEYTVAPGDTQGDICNRFGVRWWQFTYPDGTLVGTYPRVLDIGQHENIVEQPAPDNAADYHNPLC